MSLAPLPWSASTRERNMFSVQLTKTITSSRVERFARATAQAASWLWTRLISSFPNPVVSQIALVKPSSSSLASKPITKTLTSDISDLRKQNNNLHGCLRKIYNKGEIMSISQKKKGAPATCVAGAPAVCNRDAKKGTSRLDFSPPSWRRGGRTTHIPWCISAFTLLIHFVIFVKRSN